MFALACLRMLGACSSSKEQSPFDPRFNTPIAFETPPAPTGDQGVVEFAPECDAAMIGFARGAATIESTILACDTTLEWLGAEFRYPSSLSGKDDVLLALWQACFEASDEVYAQSGVCQDAIRGRTPVARE